MRFSPPYSAYARVYDQIGQRAFGERMAGVILAELSRLELHPGSVLDLGCGTGSATLAFARAGLRAVGLDRSAEMLERAREYGKDETLAVEFVEGDMIELDPLEPADLVTCIYDAVNYLAGDVELRQFFRSVYRVLSPGGAFVFDMNSRQRLMSSWEQGLMLAGDSDDLYLTYRSWYDHAIDASPLIVTGFQRQSDTCWVRFDEEHVERAWPIEDVTTWLQTSGFQVADVAGYTDATGDLARPAREEHGRVLFIATR